MDKLQAYKILGVPQNATEEDIKIAYRNLAQETSGLEQTDTNQTKYSMDELNEAFDLAMGSLREAQPATTLPTSSVQIDRSAYIHIRQLINEGRVDEALQLLGAMVGGASDAEWNFLMGSAYYYRGWLEQALQFFQTAVRLEPNNREYQAALQNLTNASRGQMPGNPYTNQNSSAAAMDCACNTCGLLCCLDSCCGCLRGS